MSKLVDLVASGATVPDDLIHVVALDLTEDAMRDGAWKLMHKDPSCTGSRSKACPVITMNPNLATTPQV